MKTLKILRIALVAAAALLPLTLNAEDKPTGKEYYPGLPAEVGATYFLLGNVVQAGDDFVLLASITGPGLSLIAFNGSIPDSIPATQGTSFGCDAIFRGYKALPMSNGSKVRTAVFEFVKVYLEFSTGGPFHRL
jgi:hypothetical protein